MVGRAAARGWVRIGPDDRIAGWAAAALPLAQQALATSHEDWRCGGTWFVGVDALTNDPDGAVAGVPLPWQALGLPAEPLHRAQLSVIRPGYPQPSPQESPAAFAFRRDRDAAHLDGLLAEGPDKRRFLREPHGWILGLPLNDCGPGASPLVVWEGSHRILMAALAPVLARDPDADLTDIYAAARKQAFASCPRVELPSRPGEATLLHRATLHGVAPWAKGATAPPEGRIIAYFRPMLASVAAWAALP